MATVNQFWMIFFLLAAGHGLFLSSVLALRSRHVRPNQSLSLLMLLFGVSLLYYVAFWTHYTPEVSPFWGLILTVPTLYGPLVYQYFFRLNSHKNLPRWHYLPFLFHLCYMTGFYSRLLGFHSLDLFNNTGVFTWTVVQNLSLIIYTVMLLRQGHQLCARYGKVMQYLTWAFAGFTTCFVTYYILVNTIEFKPEHDYFISLFMALFIYLVGYLSYGNPVSSQVKKGQPYRNSGLTAALSASYKSQLLQVMDAEKPYLNGDLKLKDLAEVMNISVHHLSEVINSQFRKNFSEFLNQYRVRDAKSLLTKDQRITEIGYQVGFNNKTSFSQTFKKYTSLTPSQYRAQYHPKFKKHTA